MTFCAPTDTDKSLGITGSWSEESFSCTKTDRTVCGGTTVRFFSMIEMECIDKVEVHTASTVDCADM